MDYEDDIARPLRRLHLHLRENARLRRLGSAGSGPCLRGVHTELGISGTDL